ncbi:protein of unknown function [Fervidobacterium changbaicum]|uniref:Uncharacterized protein n=1 Tax=Fervidobacterium changbaicum TaxID=310769 RepID=A0ABX5QRG1_9BACT|nr:DUF4940 domain-containing protein [Fervidobacterium changbaicum]QAV33037.1 hypothetical protein CBS1_04355 [Fervidobacterium changbaicum]SDH02032.1 protein of unknown function [Fervidobacterium changbaicum]
MKIYYNLEEVEEEKRKYASIAFASKVRVEYDSGGEKHAFVPVSIGDFTVLIEINDDKEVFNTLLNEYIRNSILKHFTYPEEIRELAKHFRTELKQFRILVVKYNTVEEKEFARYSLSNITFGVVSYNHVDIHLLPSNVKVRQKLGYCLSSVVQRPEEGLRQALLIARWFARGAYNELPRLALETDNIDLGKWTDLVKYVLVGDFEEKYFSGIIRKLNEFRTETYFDPFSRLETVALGIIVAKSRGGGDFEPDSYDII